MALSSFAISDKRTVPLVLSAMGASYTPDYGMIMAGLVIATLPTAIVFLFCKSNSFKE